MPTKILQIKGQMSPNHQLNQLAAYPVSFEQRIKETTSFANGILPETPKVFQINIGKKCNQACKHCHVNASPSRTEMMSSETIEQCIHLIKTIDTIEVVDITGGAPEMHSEFMYLVESITKAGKHVIDRCNLTILEEPGYEYLYDFLYSNKVEIVASLPHLEASNTDAQRGNGVFQRSIRALKKLNDLGYGTEIPLNLVCNPTGLFLSAPQKDLEQEFKKELSSKYGIKFTNLYCINNIPIQRFLELLVRRGKFEDYMNILVDAYNPTTVDSLMCRSHISVGYDGKIFDCDFNQMLELKVGDIQTFNLEQFLGRKIKTGNHCFGCTAGAGASCTGEIT